MKKILITGANSYIGSSFKKWVSQWPNKYEVVELDVRNDDWKNHCFYQYDIVFHVAAIVHVKEKDKSLYYRVNRDLAYAIAKKSKSEGVKQFIFISTMGVYGMDMGDIDYYSETNPKTHYAKSKLEAEELINFLADDSFIVTTLRPPMVYGKNCKGNFSKLYKYAKFFIYLPKKDNLRSMIEIQNLVNFIKICVDLEISGTLFPQNREYIDVSNMISKLRGKQNKNTTRVKILNCIRFFYPFSSNVRKIFGSLKYSYNLEGSPTQIEKKYKIKYIVNDYNSSIDNLF